MNSRYAVQTAIILGALAATAGCVNPPVEVKKSYPRLELSSNTVDFGSVAQGSYEERVVWLQNQGDLPMGISHIEMGDGDRSDQYWLSLSTSEIDCPETEDDLDTASDGPDEKWLVTDSGLPPEDTGDPVTDPEDPVFEDVELVLGPGCRVPMTVGFEPDTMGVLQGSVQVHTTNQQTEGDVTPEYFSDPLHSYRQLALTGEALRGLPAIAVSPMLHDFGHVWPGYSKTSYIVIRNNGSGTLTIDDLQFTRCDNGFYFPNIDDTFSREVPPEDATYLEAHFAPDSQDAVECAFTIPSNDPNLSSVSVTLTGNTGTDPNNEPPTVHIRSPQSGYRHMTRDPFEMVLNVFDVNQPADTLICKVKSWLLTEAVVADCAPQDESGYVVVTIDPEELGAGVDTLRVTVTDSSEVSAYASISVLINTDYPDDDEDGDGWGPEPDEDGNYDCNDRNPDTYPYAAEVPDGDDNNCDGIVDERTINYDDDGDSYAEIDGDCNDNDADIYPGRYESPDGKDNNCNGIVDETTALYDDDGDGYTEMMGDCDDDDPTVHPGAVEYCDGTDNNCNGLRDYADPGGCVEVSSSPYIVGEVNMQQTSCEEGDTVSLTVQAYDPDGQSLEYAWTGDEGLLISPLTGSPVVSVTCPSLSSSSGKNLVYYVTVTDEDLNHTWTTGFISVYPKGELYKDYVEWVQPEEAGCATAPAPRAAVALGWMALALVAVRRRRG